MAALGAASAARGREQTRRRVPAALSATASSGAFAVSASAEVSPAVARIEASIGGRLGVAALRVRDGRRIDYRAHERFAICSTVKLLITAAGLERVDRGLESLARAVPFADRTGTGDNGSTNVVGVIWRSRGGPILVSVYATGSSAPTPTIERAIAQATRIVCAALT